MFKEHAAKAAGLILTPAFSGKKAPKADDKNDSIDDKKAPRVKKNESDPAVKKDSR